MIQAITIGVFAFVMLHAFSAQIIVSNDNNGKVIKISGFLISLLPNGIVGTVLYSLFYTLFLFTCQANEDEYRN